MSRDWPSDDRGNKGDTAMMTHELAASVVQLPAHGQPNVPTARLQDWVLVIANIFIPSRTYGPSHYFSANGASCWPCGRGAGRWLIYAKTRP